MTNGRFNTYEIDFLDANFAGCADCFTDVGAADRWYVVHKHEWSVSP